MWEGAARNYSEKWGIHQASSTKIAMKYDQREIIFMRDFCQLMVLISKFIQ